jgi:hypothetical protein
MSLPTIRHQLVVYFMYLVVTPDQGVQGFHRPLHQLFMASEVPSCIFHHSIILMNRSGEICFIKHVFYVYSICVRDRVSLARVCSRGDQTSMATHLKALHMSNSLSLCSLRTAIWRFLYYSCVNAIYIYFVYFSCRKIMPPAINGTYRNWEFYFKNGNVVSHVKCWMFKISCLWLTKLLARFMGPSFLPDGRILSLQWITVRYKCIWKYWF